VRDEEMPILRERDRGRGDSLPALRAGPHPCAANSASDGDADDFRAAFDREDVSLLRGRDPSRDDQVSLLWQSAK
jgi:hypothetical protein